MSVFRFLITSPTAESDPNAVAPAAARVWSSSTYESGNAPTALVVALEGNGTSAIVQLWAGPGGSDLWQKEGPAVKVGAGVVETLSLLGTADAVFLQVVSVSGSPTELHVGFGRPAATAVAAAPAASVATPAAVTAGGAATALAAAPATRGVLVQADLANTTIARVGDSNVSATRGWQLAAGDSLFLPTDNASDVYHYAESGSPKLNYIVI